MRTLLPYLITGLATGSLYGLAGLGLVLTYRTSGVFNFGHGSIAAGAAFLFYTLHVTHGLTWPLAALISIGAFGVIGGFFMEWITRSLRDAPAATVVSVTVGLMLGIQGLLYIWYGNASRTFPEFLPQSGFGIAGVNVRWSQVIVVVLAAVSAVGLYAFLQRSRLGVIMRAVVDNPTLVNLAGERAGRTRLLAWIIGTGFAAVSGILLGPSLNLDAFLLTMLVVQAFGACAIGLFSSLMGTYAGGLAIGIVASVCTKYFVRPPLQGIPPSVPFLVLIGVLLVVPVAKLPRIRVSLRGLVTEPPSRTRRNLMVRLLVGGVVVTSIPLIVGTKLPVWTAGLTYVLLFASLALLVWVSGQISLCHAAFAALGATAMAHITDHGVPWLVALLLAGFVAVPVGALITIPAIRLSGIYLGLLTLGFGVFMQNTLYHTSWMFGSRLVVSAPRPKLGPIDGSNDTWLYVVTLAVTLCSCGLLVLIYRGRLGRLLRALAEAPTMLAAEGLSVTTTRLIAFCLSAFFAGIAGALAITQTGAASSFTFGPIQSLVYMAVLAICGTRLLQGPILAAALIAVLPAYATGFDTDLQMLAFGMFAVIAGIVVPKRAALAAWLTHSAVSSAGRSQRSPVRARSRGVFVDLVREGSR